MSWCIVKYVENNKMSYYGGYYRDCKPVFEFDYNDALKFAFYKDASVLLEKMGLTGCVIEEHLYMDE